ncbi:Uncharacterized phage-encoded protein [Kluyvera cryocrescens]|uniref:Uncharacterized phage-encoded protein n=1 Tax=Kluyvera cryocrescens TaxID=580 RepID=A0A485ACW8_KLUCR|nr:Uncharacterized phage-encoded protein [Kluyvera cryocrescens]
MNNPSIIPAFDFRNMVITIDNKVITTSLKVADYFGKRHKDVFASHPKSKMLGRFHPAQLCAH